jgi:hypothetical protein
MARRFKRRFKEFGADLAFSPQTDIRSSKSESGRTPKMALHTAVSQQVCCRKLQMALL